MEGKGSGEAAGRRPAEARAAVRSLGASRVREVANAGFGRSDIARFWFGESDQPTPEYLRQAAVDALYAGRTFYTHNHGAQDLRHALNVYLQSRHNMAIGEDRLSVTSSGVSALSLAMQAVLDPGDRVVIVTPVWPNVTEIPAILGARVTRIGLMVKGSKWDLDLDRLLNAITPDTRLVVINSPGNPTGWMLDAECRQPILDRCRTTGAWLLTDDVYERLAFDSPSAPSFLPISDPDDRLISANSFSKAWLMTGWRLGWLVTPRALHDDLGKLIEYSTSCAPDFVQAAGVVALRDGEPHVAALGAALRERRDALLQGLAQLPRVRATAPSGGMYVMLRVEGESNSVAFAKHLIAQHGLGLAPGAAFGPEAEGWLRWCIAVRPEKLSDGLSRLEAALGSTASA